MNYNKIFFLVFIISILSISVNSAQYYRSNPGTFIKIQDYDYPGYGISNSGSNSYFIPTKTRNEFMSFLNNKPSGISSCNIINGGWSNWGGWGACSKTCGGGIQYRYRSCTNPTPSCGGNSCTGSNTQSQSCNTHPCIQPGTVVADNQIGENTVVSCSWTGQEKSFTVPADGVYKYDSWISGNRAYHYISATYYLKDLSTGGIVASHGNGQLFSGCCSGHSNYGGGSWIYSLSGCNGYTCDTGPYEVSQWCTQNRNGESCYSTYQYAFNRHASTEVRLYAGRTYRLYQHYDVRGCYEGQNGRIGVGRQKITYLRQ